MKKCLITVIIILVNSTNSAFCLPALPNLSDETQKQVFEYPVKQKTIDENERIGYKFAEFDKDFKLLGEKLLREKGDSDDSIDRILEDLLALTRLQMLKAEMSQPLYGITGLLRLEEGHGNVYQFHSGTIRYIINIINMYIPVYDEWIEKIDGVVIRSTNYNLTLIQCEKLKEYVRNYRRLMQKVVKELEETERILKANESNP